VRFIRVYICDLIADTWE